ncbi:MAG: hypothetical protein ACRELY_15085, partial [Polyangiaceae bacterium]
GGTGADGATCGDGGCSSTCPTGFADCDGDKANGCETNLVTDAVNCGACRSVCGTANTSAAPACVKSACVFTCAPGYLHCATDSAAGCDTAEDGSNCETCGHACGGAACTAGVCDLIPIATGQGAPMGISIDGSRIYWAENTADKIRSAGLGDAVCDGTACTLVADTTQAKLYSGGAGGSSNPRHHPAATVSTGGVVFFTCNDTNSGALSVPSGGGTVVLSGSGPNISNSIVTDGARAFYTTHDASDAVGIYVWDGNQIHAPGPGATASSNLPPASDAIVLDTGRLYWADTAQGIILVRNAADFFDATFGTPVHCDMTQGGTPPVCAKVVAAPSVQHVAIGGGYLYWSEATSQTIHRYKLLDQTSGVVATSQSVTVLAADASGVYWGRSDDDSFRSAKPTDTTCDGAFCNAIVAQGIGTGPSGLALDMQHVYISFSGSGLVAKRVK